MRSISDCTCDWILDPSSITSSSRARISDRRRSRWVTLRSSSSACLSSVLIRRDPAIMWPSTSGSSTFATATCSSSGRYGSPSMMSEKVCWMWRLSASSSFEGSRMSGSSWMRATR